MLIGINSSSGTLVLVPNSMSARFQANPKDAHLVAVKRILRYLKHTPSIGLWYLKGPRFQLAGYSDSDYAGCKIDRKAY